MKIAALTIFFLASGCIGDVVDITHPMGGDMGTHDMNPVTTPKFIPDILMDINMLGCPGCHSMGQTPVLKGTAGNEDADYASFTGKANMAESSPVLQQNLMGSTAGAAHPVHPFADTTNATYLRWLAWINAGNPKGP